MVKELVKTWIFHVFTFFVTNVTFAQFSYYIMKRKRRKTLKKTRKIFVKIGKTGLYNFLFITFFVTNVTFARFSYYIMKRKKKIKRRKTLKNQKGYNGMKKFMIIIMAILAISRCCLTQQQVFTSDNRCENTLLFMNIEVCSWVN